MKRAVLLGTVVAAALAGAAGTTEAVAHDSRNGASEHPRSSYYRHRGAKPQVRGYVLRRGGYSYSYSDSINTYGSASTLYGSAPVYHWPMLERQTSAGPFDHGFFFDSGMGQNGGQSPYMQ